ncbi:Replication protein A 70 kDa DNA-binding subunit B, partial [Mucuna pruriens]
MPPNSHFPPQPALYKTTLSLSSHSHSLSTLPIPFSETSHTHFLPMAAKSVTPDAVSMLLANPSPDASSDLPEIVVQVLDLKQSGNRYMFTASDGKMKLRAILPSNMYSEVLSGNIQNLGLVRILDYTLNDIPNKSEKYLIVTKCEPVSPALETEIKSEVPGIVLKPKEEGEVKSEGAARILLTPKQEVVTKSAAQILREQHGNSAPAARMAMTRRVHPLVSLNPYQGNWTIKVSVTSKGNMRTYKNARGEGCVFNVELTDEDGTQIQATMFNDAARKFFDKFVLGKVYYISKGTLKVANKQFKTVQNDYEMTLNENSEVEEVASEASFVPETKFNFVPIDQLGPHVNKSELVGECCFEDVLIVVVYSLAALLLIVSAIISDVIGVVKNVSSTMSIRRKSDNESIPKRDITIADETKKTVVVSLWNDLATNTGQELLDMVDKSPVVAIKSLRVGDFQGVSLSTIGKSVVLINPDIPESKKLRCWYDFEGKDAAMDSVGSGSSPMSNNGVRSVYSDRVSLSHITSNPSLGDGKPAFFSIRGYVSFIKPDQAMWYRACKTCNKKVTESIGSGYWCEGCQKSDEECSLRYIMVARVCDASGEGYISVFNEEAEKIVGCSADDLDNLKSQEGEDNPYQLKLKQATWVPHLFRVSVTQNEYNNEKRQRITARAVVPVDFAAESRIMLEDISKMRA